MKENNVPYIMIVSVVAIIAVVILFLQSAVLPSAGAAPTPPPDSSPTGAPSSVITTSIGIISFKPGFEAAILKVPPKVTLPLQIEGTPCTADSACQSGLCGFDFVDGRNECVRQCATRTEISSRFCISGQICGWYEPIDSSGEPTDGGHYQCEIINPNGATCLDNSECQSNNCVLATPSKCRYGGGLSGVPVYYDTCDAWYSGTSPVSAEFIYGAIYTCQEPPVPQ